MAATNRVAEALGQAATHAPHWIQAAASMERSTVAFGMGMLLPSGALPVETEMNPPERMIRSIELRSTTRSLMTGKAFARHGSMVIVSPSLKWRMWSWHTVVARSGPWAMPLITAVGIMAVNLGTQADARALELALEAPTTPVVTRPPITSPNTTGSTERDGAGTTAPPPVPPLESVLFIGDSLLHQAFPVIQASFAEQGVETRAIGGPGTSLLFDQSRWLGELEQALDESKPDVVVIESCCGYDERREPYYLLGVPLVPEDGPVLAALHDMTAEPVGDDVLVRGYVHRPH